MSLLEIASSHGEILSDETDGKTFVPGFFKIDEFMQWLKPINIGVQAAARGRAGLAATTIDNSSIRKLRCRKKAQKAQAPCVNLVAGRAITPPHLSTPRSMPILPKALFLDSIRLS